MQTNLIDLVKRKNKKLTVVSLGSLKQYYRKPELIVFLDKWTKWYLLRNSRKAVSLLMIR